MKLVHVVTLWTLLAATSIGGLENGEAFRNRGQESIADMRVERKVTRRIRRHATRQLVDEEIMRNEDQDGTGVVTDDFANSEEEVVGALHVSSQLAARRTQEKDPTSSSSIERVASPGARFSAQDGDGVISADREKQTDERGGGGVRTLRGQHVVKQPITVFGERLVGRNAKVLREVGLTLS